MASHSQTTYFQNDVLAEATKDGSLPTLYWYVEVLFSKQEVPEGITPTQPAQYPAGYIPILPAGPNPDEQSWWSQFLADMFAAYNAAEADKLDNLTNKTKEERKRADLIRKRSFRPTLTSNELLAGLRYYVWGEETALDKYQTEVIDHICMKCGQITHAPRNQPPACECEEW